MGEDEAAPTERTLDLYGGRCTVVCEHVESLG